MCLQVQIGVNVEYQRIAWATKPVYEYKAGWVVVILIQEKGKGYF